MGVGCGVVAALVDIASIATLAVVCLAISIIPIANTFGYPLVNDKFFIELNSPSARNCVFAILVFGYVFVSVVISLIVAVVGCSALEHQGTFVIAWIEVVIGLAVLVSTGAWFGFINPGTCDEFERKITFQFYSNNTSPYFYRWLREAKCVEIAECLTYANSFVDSTCRKFFTINLILVCIIVAFAVISAICIAYAMLRERPPRGNEVNPVPEEEEEEEEEDAPDMVRTWRRLRAAAVERWEMEEEQND